MSRASGNQDSNRLPRPVISAKIIRIEKALAALAPHSRDCRLCPRECGIDREAGEKGFCGSGSRLRISHSLLHYGEEPPISGPLPYSPSLSGPAARSGSGAVFFSGCNLKCLFCQNYQISWENLGQNISAEELAKEMIRLQEQGALNINLVTPGHWLIEILKALKQAYSRELAIPVVYNSSGYEKVEILRHLEGIVDIYLPDLKYSLKTPAKLLSGAPDYFSFAAEAVLEMYCQQPVWETSPDGRALKGLLIRHLIIPGEIENSLKVLDWLSSNLSPAVGLSLMSQFYPCHQTPLKYSRRLSSAEYRAVVEHAQRLEFERLFLQPEPFETGQNLIPDFSHPRPFRWKNQTKERKLMP